MSIETEQSILVIQEINAFSNGLEVLKMEKQLLKMYCLLLAYYEINKDSSMCVIGKKVK